MNRRKFLMALASSPVVVTAPSLGSVLPNMTTGHLTNLLEGMFETRMGYLGAFVAEEISKRHQEALNASKVTMKNLNDKIRALVDMAEYEKHMYITLSFAVEMDDPVQAESLLCHKVYSEMAKLSEGKPELVWRSKPEFASEEIPVYDGMWMSAEMIEDCCKFAFDKNGRQYLLYPDKNPRHPITSLEMFSAMPSNVEEDFNTGNYMYRVGTSRINRLRMRLYMPEANHLAKPEGEAAIRI